MKSKVLFSLFAIVAALFITGCSRTPTETVEKYCEAVIKGDAAEANKYIIAAGQAFTQEMIKDFKKHEVTGVTVSDESIDGDKATVKAKLGGKTEDIQLVKEDGEWKISRF